MTSEVPEIDSTDPLPTLRVADRHQYRFFAVISLALLGVALLLVLPIWQPIILGGILGLLLFPVRRWLVNRLHVRPLIASILVYLLFVVAIAAPLTLIVTFAGQGAAKMAQTLSADPTPTAGEQDEWAADGGLEKAWENFASWLRSGAADGFAAIAKEVDALIGAALDFVIGFVLFSVFLVAFNHHYVPLRSFLLQVSPLPEAMTELYLHRARLTARDVVVGVFGIAAAQTAILWLTFVLVGIPNAAAYIIPIFLFTLIPILGIGLVTIPLGIVLIMEGKWVAAGIIWLVHLIAVSNVEFVLRPWLISREVRLNRAVAATSFIGGLIVFGFTGLFIGPMVAVLLTLSLEIYLNEGRIQSVEPARSS